MRNGFTTGSCAAAAAKAALWMLFSGREKNQITILTPKGIPFPAQIVDIHREELSVSCAVIKDGGDDPDVTTGAHIVATVSITDGEQEAGRSKANIIIDGGEGIGRVTLPGLDQPVGNAAINHVPREMITKETLEVCAVFDYRGTVNVKISCPEGEELAKKTYNPRLGITGGISVLGTTGIVEAMSAKALIDTIRVELKQQKALGGKIAVVSPGNYGQKFIRDNYGYDLDRSVKCSNFIGETLDMVKELEFEGLILVGHVGKLIKVAGGIMNTHSHEADCRMEILAAAALKAGCDGDIARAVLECEVTTKGLHILQEAGILQETMDLVMERVLFYIGFRTQNAYPVWCLIYENEFGLLASSDGAQEKLKEI